MYAMRVELAEIITRVHEGTLRRNTYTTTTPTSQDYKDTLQKNQITSAEANTYPSTDKKQLGLRGLKITNGVHSLPRPIWRDNPLSSSLHKPVKDRANGCRKREKAEREYRGAYSARLEFGCARLQGMVDLAAAKHAKH